MNRSRFALPWLALFGRLLTSAPASAQVDLGAFGRALASASASGSIATPISFPKIFGRARAGTVPVIVRAKSGVISAPELTSLGRFALGQLDPARIAALAQAHPEWSFDWSPPRHALLDKVDGWVHAASVRQTTQTSGQGVVVGIVDTGVDLAHGDLQTADHKTRVAWLLDVSLPAAGVHADLESAYGCDTDSGCAIYAGSDLDALLENNISGDEPTDTLGHGTHVASLAAGNGLSSKMPTYIGIAPEATYVVARVAQDDGAIEDADVLRAVKFVFDRAADLGMPAVVNLSLGSDFGAHDGTSALESELSSMVGPDFPGRAIVVAAGNSAGLYAGDDSRLDPKYPAPFGIHTEVYVPRDTIATIPLITPPAVAGDTQVNGAAYVWIGFHEGDDLTVGLEDKNGSWVPQLSVGQATTFTRGAVEATIFNGAKNNPANTFDLGQNGAIVIVNGTWSPDSDFAIRLEGHGTAEFWVQGTGDLDSEVNLGALFPNGLKEGTINVPASASELIGVGATLNRTSWVDVSGAAIDMPDLGALSNAPLDTVAYFSSAGPNALGVLKPDMVAPGVNVAGAMAVAADPRNSDSQGLFASAGRCPGMDECFVVDDTHAITSGTSMSAPIVSGAIALLFERDPTLTQDSVRALLQAGARPLQGLVADERQIGPGALDLEGALNVATAGDSPALRLPGTQSRLALTASYIHPDPEWPFVGYVELRDDSGNIADGFDDRRLSLVAVPTTITENLTRVASGFYQFSVSAPASSNGEMAHLQILFDDQPIVSEDVPIEPAHWIADDHVSPSGGCALRPTSRGTRAVWLAPLGLALRVALSRRRRRRHRLAK
jgi:subtilisin family serine protease